MSPGTRGQQAELHARLLRRTQNFQASLPQAQDLRQVALGILQDYPPDTSISADDASNQIRNLVPSINSILQEDFLVSPTYPISLLRDVAEFYGCLPMPALENVDAEYIATSPLRQFCWLFLAIYEVPSEDLNLLMAMIVPLRSAPIPQLAERLRPSSTRIVEATLRTPAAPRSEIAQGFFPLHRDRRSGPNRQRDAQARPSRELSPIRRGQGQENPSLSTQSPQESARTVEAIYGAFKGKKFSGDALQSIEEAIRNYNILGFQLGLTDDMKAKFFVCIFEEAAKSHFIANIREDMSYAEMESVMRAEFESDARRLQVHMTLRGLRIQSAIANNDEV